MNRDETDMAVVEATEPCACCGKPSECGIWERRVCYPCAAEWFKRAPTHGEISAKYGTDDDACRIYRDFTSRWVEARRGGAK